MTVQQLKYIVALDVYRHFEHAANACFVSQPTLSMQVKKLENEMGVSLFNRDKSPLEPTEVGSIILAKAKRILRDIDELKAFVNEETHQISGSFYLGIIPTSAPYLLPLFLKSFVEKYPDLEVHIKEVQTEHAIEQLENGSLDAAIVATPLKSNSIREIPMFYEPFFHYQLGEKKKSISTSELKPEDMLLLEKGHCLRDQLLSICSKRSRKKMAFSLESGTIESLKGLVKSGMGSTLIPRLAAQAEDAPFLQKFKAPQPVREMSLICHQSYTREAILQALHSEIVNSVPEDMRTSKRFTLVEWR